MKNTKVVTLSAPIQRGDKSVTDITVFKPNVAALRGLNLLNTLQLDTDCLLKLLPKITKPVIPFEELLRLDITDFTELSTAAISFFGKAETSDNTELPAA